MNNQGLRPAGFTDVKNETAAIRYHLEDTRKLVFKFDTPPLK